MKNMPISGEEEKKSSIFYYEPPGLCWKSKGSLILSDQNLSSRVHQY